uniref:Uncharacterized protein n=1 Tax=Musa acuminata subsp. malaccensis TaxID=214687 RepID=A0A804L078_MUSAM
MIGVDSDLIILVGLHLGHESCIDRSTFFFG